MKIDLLGGMEKNINSGRLFIKVFWSEASAPDKPREEEGIMNQTRETDLTLKIAPVLKGKYLNL